MSSADAKTIVLGITGGIGSGKSEVLSFLVREAGAKSIELDRISRDLLDTDARLRREVLAAFGKEAFFADGRPDRKFLAHEIFSDDEKRRRLNALIHPRVRTAAEQMLARAREECVPLVVLEAAIFFEEHYEELCDEVWYIRVPEALRKERLLDTRPYALARIEASFAAQLSDEAFAAKADVVIDNSGSFEETAAQLKNELGRLFP